MGSAGPLDFAGSGVVHLQAGATALAAALIVGPRLGRYSRKGRLKKIEGHSATMVTLGTIITWFGWFGMNMGSTRQLFSKDGYKYAGLIAVNTFVAPSVSSLTCLAVTFARTGVYDLNEYLRGVIVGLVCISGGAATVEPWASVIIAFIGSFAYMFVQEVCVHPSVRIDDPTHFVAIFLSGGLWGMIATALFSSKGNMTAYFTYEPTDYGAFYGGGGKLLGLNLFASFIIILWGMFWTTIFLLPFKLTGTLRVAKEVEQKVLQGKETANFARVEVMNNGPPEIFQFKIA